MSFIGGVTVREASSSAKSTDGINEDDLKSLVKAVSCAKAWGTAFI
ncbi:hypothetical protein C1A50_1809 [Paenibacillus polymyxa]|nr:hypothetical protein C1A50_1809 [Paenibacillus polymyxa]